ncbi:DUF5047 domain-containing protein [Micromonospora sp. C81]|uniref:DUF5047 domain-containing protein n=1 Tax=Micromonospora sp. C81 TaxID=2824881 RepID=UPI001B35E833|nr:DUF5047 domain-containing protein [Micromonospora sp. C81]MBQ1039285.1 DUF5047 domain-containing protein [Micromonospora sp. C81]
MIHLSDTAQSVLTRSHKRRVMVESWRGGKLLAASVPVDTATEEVDRSRRVPQRLTLTVPRRVQGVSWAPTTDTHPLAANGQWLRVQLGIEVGNGITEWFQRGWFVIHSSNADGDTVTVEAVGLLHLIDEARFVTPFQPTGTFSTTLRQLLEPAMTVIIDGALNDRAVPASMNWEEDRLGAVGELLDAWPAASRVTEHGFLHVYPATTPTTADLNLSDTGPDATIIRSTGGSTRENVFNTVVARGTNSDGAQVQGVAYDTTGPKAIGGPFNPLPVPFYFPSPLLTTIDQVNQAAQTVLDRKRQEAGREFQVEMVPHPGLQDGDTVSITTDEVSGLLCTVQALTLPYTADGGSQLLTVRSLT